MFYYKINQLLLIQWYSQSQISPYRAPHQTYPFSSHIQEIQTWSGCTQTEICFYPGNYREEIHRLRWRGCEWWWWRTGYVTYTAGYVLSSLQLLINELKHSCHESISLNLQISGYPSCFTEKTTLNFAVKFISVIKFGHMFH